MDCCMEQMPAVVPLQHGSSGRRVIHGLPIRLTGAIVVPASGAMIPMTSGAASMSNSFSCGAIVVAASPVGAAAIKWRLTGPVGVAAISQWQCGTIMQLTGPVGAGAAAAAAGQQQQHCRNLPR